MAAGEGRHDGQDVGGVHLGLCAGEVVLPGSLLPPGEGAASVRERPAGGGEHPGGAEEQVCPCQL